MALALCLVYTLMYNSDELENCIFLSHDWCSGSKYVEIDNDITKYRSDRYRFTSTSEVRKVSSSTNVISSSGSSSNMVISPIAVNAINNPGAMDIARGMSRMVDETGKEFEFKIEDPGSKFNYSLICRKSN